MTELAPTPEIGFVLPQVNTGQQWRTDEYIVGNFQKADAAFIADRARLVKLEGLLRGNTAARDAFWGTASTAPNRVALANKYPTWFNTDKGWEEQYFAQFDDGGGASTPVAATFGWKPKPEGKILLQRFTAAVLGTGTVTKKGGKVEMNAAQGVTLDGLFTTDFARYELEMSVLSVSSSTALELRFRAAGVTNASANYAYNFREIAPGAAETGAGPVTEAIISRAFSGGFMLRTVIDAPADAAKKTYMLNHMMDSDTKTRIGGAQYNAVAAFDGLWLDLSGTSTMIGDLRVYGIPG